MRRLTELILGHGHLVHLLQDRWAHGSDYIMVGEREPHPATAWWLRTHELVVNRVPALTPELLEHTVRVGTVAYSEVLEPLVDEIHSSMGEQVLVQHWPAVAESKASGQAVHLLEVFNSGVDKWTMIEKLMAMRSIRREEVVAIGDGLNDISMVRHAGRGIAMGQADPRVVEVADQVVSCNRSGGVAEAIRSVLGA